MISHRYTESSSRLRSSAGILVSARDTGRVLLGLRSEAVSHPGLWALFGGGIEPGESAAQAALRELYEEARIRVAWLQPLQATGRFHAFHAVVPHEVQPVLNFENSDARWFDPHKLPANVYPGTKTLVEQIA